MPTWEDVQRLALALPEAETGTLYGRTACKVRGKAFVWESPHEYGACVVRVDPAERALLLDADPEAYFVTNHYLGSPMLLVNLDAVPVGELRARIEDSWLLVAPEGLRAQIARD